MCMVNCRSLYGDDNSGRAQCIYDLLRRQEFRFDNDKPTSHKQIGDGPSIKQFSGSASSAASQKNMSRTARLHCCSDPRAEFAESLDPAGVESTIINHP